MPQELIGRVIRSPKGKDAIAELQRMNNLFGGGGGGGGATFVYKVRFPFQYILYYLLTVFIIIHVQGRVLKFLCIGLSLRK